MPIETSPNKFKTERYNLYTLRLPDPAAGADVFWSPDANTIVHVMSISFGYTAVNVGIDRWVFVELLNAAGRHSQFSVSHSLQPINTGYDYYFSRGVNPVDMSAVAPIFQCPFTCDLEITETDQLRIGALRINAADQFSYVDLRLREWNVD